MSADLEGNKDILELYQDIILNHSKEPRNIGILNDPDCCFSEINPLCGDKVTVSILFNKKGCIKSILFDGKGCAISIASASMMTESVNGMLKDDVFLLAEGVEKFCKQTNSIDEILDLFEFHIRKPLSTLKALSGVRNFPARLRCVTLPWEALISCIKNKDMIKQ